MAGAPPVLMKVRNLNKIEDGGEKSNAMYV
jgi:hypothetical protein